MQLLTPIKHPINRFALKLAAFSAVFGVLLVVLYATTKSPLFIYLGFFHLFPTIIIHICTLLGVVIKAFYHSEELQEYFFTIFLMLLNIPLAIGCFALVEKII